MRFPQPGKSLYRGRVDDSTCGTIPFPLFRDFPAPAHLSQFFIEKYRSNIVTDQFYK
jgi:hypothetical protein